MDLVRAALAFPRRRPRVASTAAFVTGVRPMPAAPRPAALESLLCESEDGALVLLDPRRVQPEAALLTLGTTRLEPHHLSAVARSRLLVEGRTALEGRDAENALLALAGGWTMTPP